MLHGASASLLSLQFSTLQDTVLTFDLNVLDRYHNVVAAVIWSSFLKCVQSGNCAVCWCSWLKVERGFVSDFTGQAESCLICDTCVFVVIVIENDFMTASAEGLRQQYGLVLCFHVCCMVGPDPQLMQWANTSGRQIQTTVHVRKFGFQYQTPVTEDSYMYKSRLAGTGSAACPLHGVVT